MPQKLSADDRFAISDLYYNYSFFVDGGEAQKFGELFTKDAVFELPDDVTVTGRDGMIEMCEAGASNRPAVRHIMSGVVAEATETGATGRAYVQAFRYDEGGVTLLAMGEYVDELARDGDTWRFKRRRFNLLMPGSLRGLPLATLPANG